MNELSSLGVILLFALFAGHVVKFLRIPEVTGYILAGVIVGPSMLGWVSYENVAALSVFSEVALGMILFTLGSVFAFDEFRSFGRPVLRVTITESLAAGGLVAVAMLIFGQPWQACLLLGAIASETAAASTLMVIRESNAKGQLTSTLTGVIGINNVVCLILFYLVSSILDLSAQAGESIFTTLYQALYPLVWQLIGSVALGYLTGLLLSFWSIQVLEQGELLILLIGCVLLCVGAALVLDLSPMISSLVFGATMTNISKQSRRLFQATSRMDPPFYAIFFVIAGADLNLELLSTMGAAGIAYVVCRAAGKFFGARLGARRAGLSPSVQRLLGFSLLSHAGLAVGITLSIQDRYPDWAPGVTAIVLAAVAVYEMLGPLGARLAIVNAGEANQEEPAPSLEALTPADL